jgi:hypothetical protein
MRSCGRWPSKLGLSRVLSSVSERWEDAERHFEHAVAMNDRLGAPPAAVGTRRAYAAMLLDRNAPGDEPRAAALIATALAETEQLDMPAEAAKLQRLRDLSLSPRVR